MTSPAPPRGADGPGTANHVCYLYADDEELHTWLLSFVRQGIESFVRQGIEAGEEVLCVAESCIRGALLASMRDGGTASSEQSEALESRLARGQLTFVTNEDAYVRGGVFDPDAILDSLRGFMHRTLSEGYPALRVVGGLGWALRCRPGSERLIEYETRLHEIVADSRCLVVCAYDRRQYDPATLLDVLTGHPAVIVGGGTCENFYYVAPEDRQRGDRAAELERRLDVLRRQEGTRKGLLESREWWHALLEHANDSIFVIDPPTRRFLDVNQNAARCLGYTREELLGLTIDDIDTQSAATRNDAIVRKLLETGSIVVEHAHRHKDGSEIPVEISTRLVEHRGRQVFLGLAHDISERKRAEETLAREASLNAAMVELSRALISPASLETIAALVLDQAKRLTGSAFGYVGYIDPETGWLVCPTLTRDVWDVCEVPGKDIVFKEFRGLCGWSLENRKPVLTNAPASDPRSSGTPPGHIPIERFLTVPAVIGDELLGQVAVANADHDYSERDLAIIERLASFYAIAVQRKRAEEELSRRAERLGAQYAIAREVSALRDPDDLLRCVFDVVMPLLGCNAAWVTLPGPAQDDAPCVAASRGVPESFSTSGGKLSMVSSAARDYPSGKDVGTSNERSIEGHQCVRPEVLRDAGLQSHIGIPLAAGGQVLGLLNVAWRVPSCWRPSAVRSAWPCRTRNSSKPLARWTGCTFSASSMLRWQPH